MNPHVKVFWKFSGVDDCTIIAHLNGVECALVAATRAMQLLKERDYTTLVAWLNALKEDRRQMLGEIQRRGIHYQEAADA